jgi:DNA-directed RNA polymerase specialized sigma24 family protein
VATDKLTRDAAFHALLDWLDPNRDRAGDEYVRLHRRFAKMFEARGCITPEECADETFTRVGRQLLDGKKIRSNNPTVYLDGVARNVLREQWRKPPAEPFEEVSPDELTRDQRIEIDELVINEKRHTCLEECLRTLPKTSQSILLEYYAENKSRKIETRNRMADRLGIAASVLRNRIFKLRNSLRGCISECVAR